MTVVNRKILTALFVLLLSSLACGQQIAATTPTNQADNTPTTITTPDNTPTPSRTPSPAPMTAIVRQAVVNVRQSPGGSVIGSLSAGDRVTVEGCEDDWCSISAPVTGYVFRGCLETLAGDLACEAKP